MQLTKRDLELFEILNRFHVASSGQVRRLIFPNIAKTNVFRRLRLLESKNFIQRTNGLDSGEQAWILRTAGAAHLHSQWQPYSVNKNALHHDVTLTELRMAFESVGLGQHWISDVSLKRETYDARNPHRAEGRLIPDGILPMPGKTSTLVWSVELELHLKSNARYQEIFRKYKTTFELSIAWYIIPRLEMASVLRREWERSRYSSGTLVISHLDDLLKDPPMPFSTFKTVSVGFAIK